MLKIYWFNTTYIQAIYSIGYVMNNLFSIYDLVCYFSYVVTNSKTISLKKVCGKTILATGKFKIWYFYPTSDFGQPYI